MSLLRHLAARVAPEDRRLYRLCDDFGAALINALLEQGMEPKELARRIGRSTRYVNRVMGGGVNINLQTIAKMEAVLGVDLVRIGRTKTR